MEEIRQNLYRLELDAGKPLTPPIALYFLKGKERTMMVDSGLPGEQFTGAIEEALRELCVPYENLDVFLTHMHVDHIGQASHLAESGARIFMSEDEFHTLQNHILILLSESATREGALRRFGVTETADSEWYGFVSEALQEYQYSLDRRYSFPYESVHQGQMFEYGGYRIQAKALRGHSYYQMGLMDLEQKILFCADQIMEKIVPGMTTADFGIHLLGEYCASLRELWDLPKEWTLFPGHFCPLEGSAIQQQITRIKEAFESRYNEYIDILKERKGENLTISEISRTIYGDVITREDPSAKVNILALTWVKIGHFLEYAVEKGVCEKKLREGMLYYCI